jgi:hypothetical protein
LFYLKTKSVSRISGQYFRGNQRGVKSPISILVVTASLEGLSELQTPGRTAWPRLNVPIDTNASKKTWPESACYEDREISEMRGLDSSYNAHIHSGHRNDFGRKKSSPGNTNREIQNTRSTRTVHQVRLKISDHLSKHAESIRKVCPPHNISKRACNSKQYSWNRSFRTRASEIRSNLFAEDLFKVDARSPKYYHPQASAQTGLLKLPVPC